ncbi:39S ribosomal protein L10, mitochondrial [Melitaea cinxia]|uniref:39S ribosomal protein L10, mitochondrial n=1 Tax=Melitaea cinxia TaxID=113334 RepID=UPI0004EA2701|nr:39S ribosomal protein L10, mitochondrial [Melitaea cinxia]
MSFIKKGLLQTPVSLIVAKRFRGKINVQKPRKPHFEKQLLIDISKPYYGPPKNSVPEITLCANINKKSYKREIDNPFERILAKECLDWFNTSKMVVFLHVNSISMEDKTPVFAALKKNDMHLRTYGKKIVSMATKGTRYEVINQLFTSHQNIIFGQPENAAKMFKILRKAPQLVVMGGIIEDRLISKNDLVEYSKLPSLDIVRSQLCSVLQSAGSCLVGQLNQNQQMLVSHLEKHVEIQKAPSNSTDNLNANAKSESTL